MKWEIVADTYHHKRIDLNGTTWYYNEQNQRHREDGPAIEWANGTKEWWVNGQRHREDGPAVEYADGTKYWYVNGQRHREDGPAYEGSDGTKLWYVNGHELSEEEFNRRFHR